MQKITINNIIVVLIFALTKLTVFAQVTITKPEPDLIQAACAHEGFNVFGFSFSFTESGSGLGASNQFIIELSDVNGDFDDDNPIIIYSSDPGEFTTSPVELFALNGDGFAIPQGTAGTEYKIRIISTNPVSQSILDSDEFEAYFMIHHTDFSINQLVETAEYCAGGSYLLTVDETSLFPNTISPLQFPELAFDWFRTTGTTSELVAEQTTSLSVDTPGTYFAKTHYGACTEASFSASNKVTITEVGSGGVSTVIESSLGNPYCSSGGPTILSVSNGQGFQWFKDGVEITDATNQTYETNESGIYSVNIDLGSCITSAQIDLSAEDYESEINIDIEETQILDEGETLEVILTTTANTPEFEWFLNDTQIPEATESSFEVTSVGEYRAVITQTVGGCLASTEFVFTVGQLFPDVDVIPNLISPNNDGSNDTWIIPQNYVSGTNTNIVIISAQGEIVLETDNYLNNWPLEEIEFVDVNPVYYYIITTQDQVTKKGSITVVK